MAHSEETKKAIRLGVAARYEKEGRSSGRWSRSNRECVTCKATYAGTPTQKYCSVGCKPKQTLEERRAQWVKGVSKRRRLLKVMAVEHKGGKCQLCGYSKCIEALDFHHEDATKKDFSIAGKSKSWDSIKAEIEKCVLVCANCHREIHAAMNIE